MKQITIKCFSNGTTTTDIEYLYFDRENDTTLVTIEYPQEVASWHKRADILVGFDKTVDLKVGTSETLSFLLGAEHLKKGYLTIQPVATNGTDIIKWEHVKYSVRTSLNVLESDVSVTPSIAEILQGEIDNLADTKVDKVEGKSLILDTEITRLSTVTNYNDTQVLEDITNLQNDKVDKVTGKVLSSNDYTDDEKSKLAGIQENAQVNSVVSVNERVGEIELTKEDVGLSNVDNTSDLGKPISTAQATASINQSLRLVKNGNIVCIGDSITIGQTNVRNYPFWLQAYYPSLQITNRGVAGTTISYHIADIDNALILNPDSVLLLIGTNDTTGTVQDMIINYKNLVLAYLEKAIKPIIITLLPRTDDVAKNLKIKQFNDFLREHFAIKYGLTLIDGYSTFCESDGSVKVGYLNVDGLHPGILGYQALAKRISDYLPYPKTEKPWSVPGDLNTVLNPTFTLDTNSDGRANNWLSFATSGVTVSYQLINHPTDGQWQQMTRSGGVNQDSQVRLYQDILGIVGGETWMFGIDVDTDSIGTCDINVTGTWMNSTGATVGAFNLLPRCAAPIQNTRIVKNFIAPATAVKASLLLVVFGQDSAVVRFGRVVFKKIFVD